MLDIKFIRDNAEHVKQKCRNRRVDVYIDELLRLDDARRALVAEADGLRSVRKKTSKTKPLKEEMEKMKGVGENLKKLEDELNKIEKNYTELLTRVPNMTHPDAPVGGEKDFAVLETMGEPTKFDFEPKDHEELMSASDLIDFERGTKVAGAKFYFVKNDAVRLNQALIAYGIDVVAKHGYALMQTPDMVKQEILDASGFNPRGQESQIYDIEGHDLHLIGTAEIPLLGYHANETLDFSDGPKKCAAFSHCFRTEGGAYGKANKGLYRVHQFAKLEMFIFCKPEESEAMHQELLAIEKEILDGLELPYRVIDIATGDLGGPAYRKYDIEAWMPFLSDYGEIKSASNCTDYQARRLGIKYKKKDGSAELVHTLNGTAIVLTRFPVAIVENFQQKDGRIAVPKVLQKYVGKKVI